MQRNHSTSSALYFIGFLCVFCAVISSVAGCKKETAAEEPRTVFNDQYSLYILDTGDFEVIEPEYPVPKEFLILRLDGIEISCGTYLNAYLTEGALESNVATIARDTIQNSGWLPGINRWMLDAEEITIDNRWFYMVTLLVRRSPELTEGLTEVQKLTHSHELERYEVNVDYIVRLYYAVADSDVHIFTLSGQPEDVVTHETEIRRLLANVRTSATEATAAQEYGESQD